MKHIIFGFIAFIHHNKYVQITQTGTHQYTMYHNIQTLLDMSQRSHNLDPKAQPGGDEGAQAPPLRILMFIS